MEHCLCVEGVFHTKNVYSSKPVSATHIHLLLHQAVFPVYHLSDGLPFASSNSYTPVRSFLSGLAQHIRYHYFYTLLAALHHCTPIFLFANGDLVAFRP